MLLCEVEGRQGIAQLFDVPPLPYEERRVARGTTGAGDVYALAIDAESALLEYLDMYYRLGRAGKALDRFGVIEFATTIAPGVRDVLLTGKVYEAANRNRRNKGAREYDAIVLDAPPTGRISQFLNVNNELAGLAKVGPIKSQADVVMKLLRSSRTAIHLVTVLEEMPVQETGDGIAELRGAGLPVGGVIVNMVRPQDLDADERAGLIDGTVDREALVASLEKAGISADDELVDGLLEEGHDHAERRQPRGHPAGAGRGARRPDVRAAADARRRRPRRALRARRGAARGRTRMNAPRHHPPELAGQCPRRAAGRHPRAQAAPRRRRPARRPQPRDHRVLRLRRRRQDHHVRRPRAAGGRARPQGRRAHHRPGPPAGAVDGHRVARQHPAAGARA